MDGDTGDESMEWGDTQCVAACVGHGTKARDVGPACKRSDSGRSVYRPPKFVGTR